MKCACGMEFGPGGKYAFGYHRRECPAFWQSIKTEMENISRRLHGEIAPVSSREWDMRRPREQPRSKSLIDWLGSWSAVLAKVGLSTTMPTTAELASMVRKLSRQYYGNGWIIGGNVYDELRPRGWPTYRHLMKRYGYSQNQEGWRQFAAKNGMIVVTNAQAQEFFAERRHTEIALADGTLTLGNSEQREAQLYRSGLPICEETYLRTGRMFVR